ncbi:hypothetical protein Kfla_5985 [Kribbella flavida DSM 17836]|uniref:Uncharacterized protein n=1 Tax=Kribbella flavida (strain DSM 17836 / JCM 10339 / NBRC 14399) TaxID=479435 RepID=D2PST6_KRIFD|nr:hypothetical protein [Kribbella flavida]ADB34988.1 hypothetical protein Kfla_5985 [Kribbella flavida DSM 17836]
MRRFINDLGDRLLAAVVPTTKAEAWNCPGWNRVCECYLNRNRCADWWLREDCAVTYKNPWEYGGNCIG